MISKPFVIIACNVGVITAQSAARAGELSLIKNVPFSCGGTVRHEMDEFVDTDFIGVSGEGVVINKESLCTKNGE